MSWSMSPSIARLWITTRSSPSGRNSTCGECMARRIGTRSHPSRATIPGSSRMGRRRPTKEEIRAPAGPAAFTTPSTTKVRPSAQRISLAHRLLGGCRTTRDLDQQPRAQLLGLPDELTDERSALDPPLIAEDGDRCVAGGESTSGSRTRRALSASHIVASYPHAPRRSTVLQSLRSVASSNHRMCPLWCHHSPGTERCRQIPCAADTGRVEVEILLRLGLVRRH